MHTARLLGSGRIIGAAALIAATLVMLSAWQVMGQPTLQFDNDDITGVVTGPNGPEAGVWVIAETTDLPTKYNKTVVTDDQGRYLLPDLPSASYTIWVRGYGLVDSPRVQANPGRVLDLRAVPAPSALEAAQIYPAGYWLSLANVPAASEFPGTGPDGNGIELPNQHEWLFRMKMGGGSCGGSCHNVGMRSMREIPENLLPLGSYGAWDQRTRYGQAGVNMTSTLNAMGRRRALEMFSNWSDRIAAGEIPPTPPRPQGLERNVVITQWDWADTRTYLHDLVTTDRRNPTVNAFGPMYGATELSRDYVPVLDPITHTVSRIELTLLDPNTPPANSPTVPVPSPYWGEEAIWNSKASVHNPMLDEQGRLWLTQTIRPSANPEFCREGSSHPSAQAFPNNNAGRHLSMYDPRTQQWTLINTCFSTHHLMFAEDENHTLWTSGGGQVVGWLNRKMFDETGDAEASQGWTPLILDTNGNGVRDAYVGPNDQVDPTMDKRISAPFYGVAPSVDGSVWGSVNDYPGGVVRLGPGPNPSETALAEYYEPPYNNPSVPIQGWGPRGMDIDRNGVVWTALGSGHLASFDRRKCQGPLNGPEATGQQCPEGWTLYPEPIPQFKGVTDAGSSSSSYYTWVDQFNTSGLGENTPINTGQGDEGLLALKDGRWVVLRVPYPNGFFAKWVDGRVDDPNGGWKGRGLWATIANRAPWHSETGPGTTPKVMHFQMRPDPLAR